MEGQTFYTLSEGEKNNLMITNSPYANAPMDNITTGGSDSLNLSFDRLDVRSQHFFPIEAVRNSAVPAPVRASGKCLWCSVWLNNDQLSPLCCPRPTQSRP